MNRTGPSTEPWGTPRRGEKDGVVDTNELLSVCEKRDLAVARINDQGWPDRVLV